MYQIKKTVDSKQKNRCVYIEKGERKTNNRKWKEGKKKKEEDGRKAEKKKCECVSLCVCPVYLRYQDNLKDENNSDFQVFRFLRCLCEFL